MSRLIDADAFIDEINKRIKEAHKWYDATQSDEVKVRAEQAIATFCEASLTAKRMPTVKERKTGKWIKAQYPFEQCSICGAYFDTASNQANYCCVCGTRME